MTRRNSAGRRKKSKIAFNEKFLKKDKGIYSNGTQTSSVLPLAFGMVPEEYREKVFGNLVDNIMVKCNGHVGTGIVGIQNLMRTLSRERQERCRIYTGVAEDVSELGIYARQRRNDDVGALERRYGGPNYEFAKSSDAGRRPCNLAVRRPRGD